MSHPSGRPRRPISQDDKTSLPPWEHRGVARVPYVTAKTDPLTMAEKEALPAYWAADGRQAAESQRPRTHSKGQRSIDRIKKQFHYEDREYQCRVSTPNTAPPFASPSPPELPPKDFHPGLHSSTKSASQLPTWVKGPPSPPESFTSSTGSDNTVFSTGSQPCVPVETSPPARSQVSVNTSHHDRPLQRSRTRSAADRKTPPRSWSDPPAADPKASAPRKESLERAKFGTRFKSAFKDMFKREPIDESQFERIHDKHWTDE